LQRALVIGRLSFTVTETWLTIAIHCDSLWKSKGHTIFEVDEVSRWGCRGGHPSIPTIRARGIKRSERERETKSERYRERQTERQREEREIETEIETETERQRQRQREIETERETERETETDRDRETERDEPEYSVLLVDRDETSGQEEINVENDDQKAKEPKDFWAMFLIQQLHRVSIGGFKTGREREVEGVILTRHPLENSSQRPQQRKSTEGRRWRWE
jgi:hypothetical protein